MIDFEEMAKETRTGAYVAAIEKEHNVALCGCGHGPGTHHYVGEDTCCRKVCVNPPITLAEDTFIYRGRELCKYELQQYHSLGHHGNGQWSEIDATKPSWSRREGRTLEETIKSCHVRSAVIRKSKPDVKYWYNHDVPIIERVPEEDKKATDWLEFDPRDDDRCSLFMYND